VNAKEKVQIRILGRVGVWREAYVTWVCYSVSGLFTNQTLTILTGLCSISWLVSCLSVRKTVNRVHPRNGSDIWTVSTPDCSCQQESNKPTCMVIQWWSSWNSISITFIHFMWIVYVIDDVWLCLWFSKVFWKSIILCFIHFYYMIFCTYPSIFFVQVNLECVRGSRL